MASSLECGNLNNVDRPSPRVLPLVNLGDTGDEVYPIIPNLAALVPLSQRVIEDVVNLSASLPTITDNAVCSSSRSLRDRGE